MFENVVQSIICSEFERNYGRRTASIEDARNYAMKVTFNLSPDYAIEEGYRHLDILIYSGGMNYIGVYARTDWTVIRKEWSDGEQLDVKGQSPWILYGYHDSCWRDAVRTLLWEFRERVATIDSLFSTNGWWTAVTMTVELREELQEILRKPYDRERITLKDVDFQFPVIAAVGNTLNWPEVGFENRHED